MEANVLAGSPPAASGTPQRWWQWVLVYPTLAISMLGSMPTITQWYQSRGVPDDVPIKLVAEAKGQNDLWEANFECTSKANFETVTNIHNRQVSAIVCPSGDVLVKVKLPGSEKEISRWVGVQSFEERKRSAANLIMSDAVAAGERIVLAQATSVVCQRWLNNGRLLRRVRDGGGHCFDEVINTYTGALESRLPARCDGGCQ